MEEWMESEKTDVIGKLKEEAIKKGWGDKWDIWLKWATADNKKKGESQEDYLKHTMKLQEEEDDRQKREKYALDIIHKVLKEADIKLYVGGCGCCDSPWIKIEHNGELIAKEGDIGSINMFDDE